MITAKGRNIDWHERLTVAEVVRLLGYEHPLVFVRVNGRVVRSKEWDSFLVPDGAAVDVLPIVAGG